MKRRNKEKAPLKTVNQLNLISKPNPLSKLGRTLLASSLRIATDLLEHNSKAPSRPFSLSRARQLRVQGTLLRYSNDTV